MLCLVTGASGFLGGHVAEALIKEGHQVRTIVRPTSERKLLDEWGVESFVGDMTDPELLAQACNGVQWVIHCAAKVGEWGDIEEYRRVNVEGTRRLLEACKTAPIDRFVLVSSLGVYPARDHFGTAETETLPEKHIDSYTQTKVESEKLAREFCAANNIPLVVIRPGFIYGPRDRTVMPRIIKNLQSRLVTYFGSRDKKINNTYVGNVVEAILLGLQKPEAVGEVFNVRDPELVTKKEYFETIADLAGKPKPVATYPLWFAKGLCVAFETVGKTFKFQPLLNGARLKFMGLNLDYSIDKAKRELGYVGKVPFREGIQTTFDWLRREKLVEEKA